MLKYLRYSVTFPSTERTFKNEVYFEPGLTAVIGQNESGKSVLIEMIDYALFGKIALRGPAADYKSLEVELETIIRYRNVKIYRSKTKERLLLDDEEVAVGAEAINKFIVGFMGYNFDVHCIASVARQNDLLKLTSMRPSERKAMIDQLTDMGLLEAVEKECGAKSREARLQAETLADNLVVPTIPEEPVGYQPSEMLLEKIERAKKYEALMLPVRPLEPDEPEPDPDLLGILHEQVKEFDRVQAERTALERGIANIPDPESTPEELTHNIKWAAYQKELTFRGPKPEYDQETIDRYLHDLEILKGTHITCPKCGETYNLNDPDQVIPDEPPPISYQECMEQNKRISRWAEPLEVVDPPTKIIDIKKEEQAHGQAQNKKDYRAQIDNLPILPDVRSEYTGVNTRVHIWNTFRRDLDCYTAKEQLYRADSERYRSDQTSTELTALYGRCCTYESERKSASERQDIYDSSIRSINEFRSTEEEFGLGKRAITATRVSVKQELVPSLSKAASNILTSLTDGQRNFIAVDEDFNIRVDGQLVDTLSGSGKGVVNLALRIALGRILTSNVMSIFIGDEIDGAMDKTRAEATHKTFRSLAEHLGQVILVTHREIEADHIISL